MPRRPARITGLAISLAALLAVSLIGPATADIAVSRVVSAETYARSLLNCTRSGGWVERDGSCVDRGSGKHSAYRKPLPEHRGISREVAWPWARAMVAHEVCGHVISGKPDLGRRLARKGFSHRYYGENVGCSWSHGEAHDVVLATHLAMQAEKRTGGGHWKNMKDSGYRSVGIGVATRDGTTMVVYDFYGRRW